MSILKWFGSSCFARKEEALITCVKRFCTNESTEIKKSNPKLVTDGRENIDINTKLRYMKSEAYKKTYGDLPVWTVYIRNFRGSFPPRPRENCIVMHKFTSGSPCPICRDKYLVADYRNIDLLKQFISPYGGEIISNRKTGLCQKQHFNILVAINKARDLGLLSFPVPFRRYDYSLYQK